MATLVLIQSIRAVARNETHANLPWVGPTLVRVKDDWLRHDSVKLSSNVYLVVFPEMCSFVN